MAKEGFLFKTVDYDGIDSRHSLETEYHSAEQREKISKAEWEKTIVAMYNNATVIPIDDIWEWSSFSNRSSEFRILVKDRVSLNRGNFSGSLG